ncbi:hypothetical protein M2272_001062 [Mycobacterium frederiksbergense]|uniref:Uncharacterized protein n=1 Tax=Mycolicibacterium frederiksbergense TaxID=117567 RepID=A0ABT6KV14_9MYCO|nr:hypothetical protein [Mycolicibacterium frederiksbergense]MDH6194433.1 hypothetical protein [Mycolicibacterium frederiksbergense]
MSDSFPLKPGETTTVAMLSPCVGGLVRTWTDSGPSRLWSVRDADYLQSMQATGTIARTLREEDRFREVGLLSEDTGTLMLRSRYPLETDDDRIQYEASVIDLQPAREPAEAADDDMLSLLAQAIEYALTNNEFLVVEKGGWDAPTEPFCLFIVIPDGEGFVSIIETAPEPYDSHIWAGHIVAGEPCTTLSAPASTDTIQTAPLIMLDAIATWGLQPWDLALTFGTRGG